MKPVVKITGEFWAQITEGDGNFHMFDFLEREGAQVLVEPIATWVAYLMYQAKAHATAKWPVNRPHRNPEWYEVQKHFANYFGLRKKLWGIGVGERCGITSTTGRSRTWAESPITSFRKPNLAELAHPFYNQFARGGEGHLEVGKNVYYTVHQLCHMVLALKPFGCMPSSQSDGVQSAVVNKFKDMIFLPIETSGEGEVNAHSRVQMALGEAKVKAKTEFEQCLKSTGKSLDEIREYIAEHPELRRPFYHVPHREGVAGTAAQFILHVSDRMDKSTRLWKRSRVPGDRHAKRRVIVVRDRRLACNPLLRRDGGHHNPKRFLPLIGDTMHDHLGQQPKPQLFQIAPAPPQRAHDHHTEFMVGLDVGSTTVKASSWMRRPTRALWQDYQRHETKQPEKTLEFLRRMETEVGINRHNTRMFMTGSGGGAIADQIGAKFVQEVTAVSLAVEKMHPEVYSVIELGGQDAKIIVFKDDDETGRKKKIPSMNDKCAGGTGAVIDKINAKLKIPVAGTVRPGLSRHQAAQSRRQVRRLRRDRHQQPAESRHAAG